METGNNRRDEYPTDSRTGSHNFNSTLSSPRSLQRASSQKSILQSVQHINMLKAQLGDSQVPHLEHSHSLDDKINSQSSSVRLEQKRVSISDQATVLGSNLKLPLPLIGSHQHQFDSGLNQIVTTTRTCFFYGDQSDRSLFLTNWAIQYSLYCIAYTV